MDSSKLEMLLTVIRTGSFSKAAAQMRCTQSAVTQAMNHLESELGLKLLLRKHNGVRLTPEGEELMQEINAAEAALLELKDKAGRIAEGRANPIRIGAFSSISNTWLPDVIRGFKERYPYSGFSIRIGTNDVTKWLQNGEIDIALIDDFRDTAFDFCPLMDDPFFAVVSKDSAESGYDSLTMEELTKYPFIMARQNSPRDIFPKMPENCITVDSDDDSAILAMVGKGLGITVMPKLCLDKLPDDVTAVPIRPELKRVLGMAMTKAPTGMTEAFSSFMKEHIRGREAAAEAD